MLKGKIMLGCSGLFKNFKLQSYELDIYLFNKGLFRFIHNRYSFMQEIPEVIAWIST